MGVDVLGVDVMEVDVLGVDFVTLIQTTSSEFLVTGNSTGQFFVHKFL